MKARIAIVAAAAALAGCSWSDVLVKEMKGLPPGQSFGYAQGYEDGCKTGIALHGGLGFDRPDRARDDARVRTEPDYARGWADGERNCTERHAGLFLLRRGVE